jgi:hypothetical protein
MIVAYLPQTQNLMSNIWGSDNLWQLGFGYFEVKDSAMRIRVAERMMKVMNQAINMNEHKYPICLQP